MNTPLPLTVVQAFVASQPARARIRWRRLGTSSANPNAGPGSWASREGTNLRLVDCRTGPVLEWDQPDGTRRARVDTILALQVA